VQFREWKTASTRVIEGCMMRIESQSQTLGAITMKMSMKMSVLAKEMAVGVET